MLLKQINNNLKPKGGLMPSQLALNTHAENAQIQSGKIIAINSECYQIKINSDYYRADKAFSCRIKPQVGDVVQLSFMENDIFITDILTRQNPEKIEIDLPQSTDIACSGKINLQASHISQKSINYEVATQQATFTAKALQMLCKNLYQLSEFRHIQTSQLLKEVKIFEQSVIQQLRMIIHKDWRIDSDSTQMYSKKDTTIDARTISLG
jgi:hypothetical protein